jgi:DNA transposition AAA+ family ATPase
MKNIFLETGNVSRFREALSVLEDTERGRPGLMTASGQAGRGKTVAGREHAVRTKAVYIRVLQDWTPRAMLAELCRNLDGSEPGTTDRAKKLAISFLNDLQEKKGILKTILVDEADRLSIGLVEHLRDVHDLTGAPIVLIGEEHLNQVLRTKSRLWDRVVQKVEFGPITAEDIMLFALEAAGLRLDPDVAKELGRRSGGGFRLVWTDVYRLEQMAKASGTNKVEMKMVEGLNGVSRGGAEARRRGNGS